MFQPPRDRLFFALKPPVRMARQIANGAEWFGGGPGAIAPERLHMTVLILEDHVELPRGLVERLLGIGDRLAAAPFEMVLDTVTGSRSSIAMRPRLKNYGFASLHGDLRDAAARAGIAERADHKIAPHLTLGYREGPAFSQPVRPVAWQVEEVVLIHSHLGRTRHETIGRWALTGVSDGGQLALF